MLNLRQVDNPGDADEKVVHWAKIFKAKTLKELEELAGEQEVFKHMVLELKKLSADEKIQQQMAARADYESRMATERGIGYREGEAKGKAEGEANGIIKGIEMTFINMLSHGFDVAQAIEITGISKERAEELVMSSHDQS